MKEKDSPETKPVSFRLTTDKFQILHEKGQAKGLSAHEFACKMIQDEIERENYQVSHEAIPMKDTVTHSQRIFLSPLFIDVFLFNEKELKSLYFAFTGKDCLPCNFYSIRIGIDEFRGVRKIAEDTWEVEVGTNVRTNERGDTWNY